MRQWVVPEWADSRSRAHLVDNGPRGGDWRMACTGDTTGNPREDDGRPRCKRCLAAERKAKEAS